MLNDFEGFGDVGGFGDEFGFDAPQEKKEEVKAETPVAEAPKVETPVSEAPKADATNSSPEEIIEKIINGGKFVENKILFEAYEEANKLIVEAKKFAENIKSDSQKKADEVYQTALKTGASVSGIDSKNALLTKKKEIIAECFEMAKEQILEMKKPEYLSFIMGLIKKYAKKNDQILLSKADKKKIGKDLTAFLSKSPNNLTMLDSDGDFEGGIVLMSNGVDKNLKLDTLIKEKYTELEKEVLEMLEI